MRKSLILTIAFLLLFPASGYAGAVMYCGGQFFVKGEDVVEAGGGLLLRGGFELNPGDYPLAIVWGSWNGYKVANKDEELIRADEGEAGISILTEPFLWNVSGAYLNVQGGAGKIPGEDIEFSNFLGGGFWVSLSKSNRTLLWFGGGHSNTGDHSTWSLDLGLSLKPKW